jgi:hypothetical protein
MESEGSLMHSQVPVTCTCPETDRSCPCPNIQLHIMVRTIQKVPGLGLILPPKSRSINRTLCHIVRLCVYEQTTIIALNCANRFGRYCGDAVCFLPGVIRINFMY